jgi:hypothetical protein
LAQLNLFGNGGNLRGKGFVFTAAILRLYSDRILPVKALKLAALVS